MRILDIQANRLLKSAQWFRVMMARLFARSSSDVLVTSMDLSEHKALVGILKTTPGFYSRIFRSKFTTVIGWGRKWSGERALAISKEKGLNFLLIEDGFLRSVGRLDDTLSLVFDKFGIYYDATQPSKIEQDISKPLVGSEVDRARNLIRIWRDLSVSKYNGAREYAKDLPERYVLVLDQVVADMSIECGMANKDSFHKMLAAALDENPESTIVVKLHPDVFTRSKASHFDLGAIGSNERVHVIAENCHPVRLIANAEAVYTVTSQVGFEALIWGKKVRCFGMPFYAGWGLTKDELQPPDRRISVSIEQLVHGALINYPRYIDPETGKECEVETVVRYLGLQRKLMMEFPENLYALNFSRWKIPFLRKILNGSNVELASQSDVFPEKATLVQWGSSDVGHRAPIHLSIEDGFLRSSGLGADLVQPLSWIVDDLGLYYNPHSASRIENILQNQMFDVEMIARAKALRKLIISAGISKYNLAAGAWRRPDFTKTVILVAGQVESDASIKYGTTEICTNIGLLRTVREANPHAYIVYKPHPDVVAGLRRAGAGDLGVTVHCNEVIEDADPIEMLSQVDEVHTMTSLIGFEALLRGVKVTCYGQPFYAGWGLTNDITPVSKRTRKIDVDQLVAGALIEYPRYISRVTNRFTTPERAVIELIEWRKNGPSRMPIWRRGLRVVLRLWAVSGLRRNA